MKFTFLKAAVVACGALPLAFAWSVNKDIRVNGSLVTASQQQSYYLVIDQCSQITQIATQKNLGFSDAELSDLVHIDKDTCQFKFTQEDEYKWQPAVKLTYADGIVEQVTESFSWEQTAPEISIQSIDLVEVAGEQGVVISITASDNTDLTRLSANVLGLKASDLKSVGGVIDDAKQTAFIQEQELSQYPQYDGQPEYSFFFPFSQNLSQAEFAANGLLVLTVSAEDASGNINSYSDVRLAGDNISEKVLGFSVSPQNITITDLLQSVSILPEVEFEFRGATLLPGAGNGVTYSSSQPDLVDVTTAGVVYAKRDAQGETAEIYVDYPGQVQQVISIQVNSARQLTGFAFSSDNSLSNLSLSQLNQDFTLPEIYAVFDDGSINQISNQFDISISLPSQANGLLSLSQDGASIRALQPVAENLAQPLIVTWLDNPAINGQLMISAKDALPNVTLSAANQVVINNDLLVSAQVSDDVDIEYVEFYLHGQLVNKDSKAPYQLSLPVAPEWLGTELAITAIAYDSRYQQGFSNTIKAVVQNKKSINVPEYLFEKPVNSQRIVEQSASALQISVLLGDKKSVKNLKSGVSAVEFFIDDASVGKVRVPLVDIRKEQTLQGEQELVYETWMLDWVAPDISLRETSATIYAHVYVGNEFQKSETRLIKLVENQSPVATILSPVQGNDVVAGQTLSVKATIADDTLFLGTNVQLLVNGSKLQEQDILDPSKHTSDLFAQSEHIEFELPVLAESVGSSLDIQLIVTDINNQRVNSEPIKVVVANDQPQQRPSHIRL
ncbi:Ig-like domain-containing protein [Catenovulum sediminis]|uniref:Ig-like domain-containing protein n=1 Tax=Catenovulum sediminis TaxID=1740262 RepID=UPI00117DA180|nr:Ig-like domain-containing protein [Catenovulum sediminis]